MAPRKKKTEKNSAPNPTNAYISGAGNIVEQRITDTLETNYMPYAMSVIVSRAIPEIDGFKPSHRKLLYTMYKMGLLGGKLTKSANIVGATMKLNPHGDSAIYETMVRLSEGNEALLHPFVESKGSFGKAYSRDMAYAAARYTEARLSKISAELFSDIDKDTVDMVDNYDATMKEPTLFPVTFPSVLVNANTGIAVGMASNICPFNLKEVCETAVAFLKDENICISDTLLAPDFPGGGRFIYNRDELQNIYETGRGSFKVRGVYSYDKSANCIDITQIPPTTTVEQIIEKVVELAKVKKITEINDIRDETDRGGLKITIDLKRGADPEKFMQKMYRMTPLQDSFSCNFNILIAGSPRVMGIREILREWTAFRTDCVRRRTYFNLDKAKSRLHLLEGLSAILLDIDKAVKTVRETKEEREVVPNLMIEFGIDEIQAEYVAEIKLRHLNREFILKRLADIDGLRKDIEEYNSVLSSKTKIRNIIAKELEAVAKKYGQERKTEIIMPEEIPVEETVEEIPDYPVNIFITRDGYFKKITPQSLRMSGEQKLKEGDEIVTAAESANRAHLLFFTENHDVYKSKASDFDDTKASLLGDFVPQKLKFENGDRLAGSVITTDYSGYVLFFFTNGRVSKVPLSAYETKTNRKKLMKAYCDKFELCKIMHITEDCELLMRSSGGRMLLFNTAAINAKSTKDNSGVAVMTQKKGQRLLEVTPYKEGTFAKPTRYRTRNLPAAGALPSPDDEVEQLSF